LDNGEQLYWTPATGRSNIRCALVSRAHRAELLGTILDAFGQRASTRLARCAFDQNANLTLAAGMR
jgi:hypothetical protein